MNDDGIERSDGRHPKEKKSNVTSCVKCQLGFCAYVKMLALKKQDYTMWIKHCDTVMDG